MPVVHATLPRLIRLLAVACVLLTTAQILGNYASYFPADFRSDFLLGREAYFYGPYAMAFYAHLLAGPLTLLAGPLLLSDRFRRRFLSWHRALGKLQVALVVLVISPTGVWMSAYAGGMVATVGFAALAILTGVSALRGWRRAVERRLESHRWWMVRCYVLLCSTVVLRKIGGLSEVLSLEWTYPLAAWVSWLLPLVAVELYRLTRQSLRRPQW